MQDDLQTLADAIGASVSAEAAVVLAVSRLEDLFEALNAGYSGIAEQVKQASLQQFQSILQQIDVSALQQYWQDLTQFASANGFGVSTTGTWTLLRVSADVAAYGAIGARARPWRRTVSRRLGVRDGTNRIVFAHCPVSPTGHDSIGTDDPDRSNDRSKRFVRRPFRSDALGERRLDRNHHSRRRVTIGSGT